QRRIGAGEVVALVAHQRARPDFPEEFDVRPLARGDRIARQRLDDVKVSQAESLELAYRKPEGRGRVAVGNVVEWIGRRQSHADAVAAPLGDQSLGRLDQEAGSI